MTNLYKHKQQYYNSIRMTDSYVSDIFNCKYCHLACDKSLMYDIIDNSDFPINGLIQTIVDYTYIRQQCNSCDGVLCEECRQRTSLNYCAGCDYLQCNECSYECRICRHYTCQYCVSGILLTSFQCAECGNYNRKLKKFPAYKLL